MKMNLKESNKYFTFKINEIQVCHDCITAKTIFHVRYDAEDYRDI